MNLRSHRTPTLLLTVALLPAAVLGAPLADYLPADVEHDPTIPKPAEILGFEVGEWHARPEQIHEYARRIADSSERVTYEVQSFTHERRPQPLLVITSPRNHARLEELREQRRRLFDPRAEPLGDAELESMPAVVFLGYSIHGNEASGANASLLVMYHLAAGGGPVERWLEDVIVLLDPTLNPDGLARFATWVNMHRGEQPVADRQNREHVEVWPGGRTNHYWFDLNRDWLLLQHPESRGRVATLHRWKPNLLGDFHEMGTDSTFFFQPGIPTRNNPLIPARTVELTERLAHFHADRLDAENRLYYTRESFDDFYPGKGSTYPDIQGAVGVLFEQASTRGHLAESVNGTFPFSFGIKNQFLSSLSMIEGLAENRVDFLRHQRDFFLDALSEAGQDRRAGFVFAVPGDRARALAMVELLRRHDVEVHPLARPLTVDEEVYPAGDSWFVPVDQPQYLLVRSLFETVTEFPDSSFYDVSTWTLPLAFDAHWHEVLRRGFDRAALEPAIDEPKPLVGRVVGDAERAYAYLFEWSPYWAPRALHRLQRAGVAARVANDEIVVRVGDQERRFAAGSIVVPVGLDGNDRHDLAARMRELAELDGLEIVVVETGLSVGGLDLGSPQLRALPLPRPLIVGGDGVSGYETGEAWYLLDHDFDVVTSIVEMERLGSIDLDRYTHLILPNGAYGRIPEAVAEEVGRWVRDGGTVVGIKGGAVWANRALLGRETEVEPPETEPDPDPERRLYGRYREERATQLLAGAVMQAELDLTHPLAFGYSDPLLPVFRTSTDVLPPSDNPYENVAFYGRDPLLSGYASPENRERLSGAVAVMATRVGEGAVIQLLDNPNFRAYFRGTSRLFLNSVFLSSAIEPTSRPEGWH